MLTSVSVVAHLLSLLLFEQLCGISVVLTWYSAAVRSQVIFSITFFRCLISLDVVDNLVQEFLLQVVWFLSFSFDFCSYELPSDTSNSVLFLPIHFNFYLHCLFWLPSWYSFRSWFTGDEAQQRIWIWRVIKFFEWIFRLNLFLMLLRHTSLPFIL